jgi:hypothetical protein
MVTTLASRVPGFLTREDIAFERDLIRTSGSGFFHGRPIDGLIGAGRGVPAAGREYPFGRSSLSRNRIQEKLANNDGVVTMGQCTIDEWAEIFDSLDPVAAVREDGICPPLRPEWDAHSAIGAARRRLEELGTEIRIAEGELRPVASKRQAKGIKETDVVRQKQEAFAMWLLLQPDFRSQLANLKSRWECEVRQNRRFPINASQEGNKGPLPHLSFSPEFTNEYTEFCTYWGLERMLTWDVPLPLNPLVDRSVPAPDPFESKTGVSVFLPFYLLRGKNLSVRDLLERVRAESMPDQFATWFGAAGDPDRPADGEVGLQQQFWLYRSYVLVLLTRYAEKCERNREKLNAVIADVLGKGQERVRKLRLALLRELGRGTSS